MWNDNGPPLQSYRDKKRNKTPKICERKKVQEENGFWKVWSSGALLSLWRYVWLQSWVYLQSVMVCSLSLLFIPSFFPLFWRFTSGVALTCFLSPFPLSCIQVCVFPSFLPDRFSTWCVSHSIVISDCLSSEFCLFIWTCCLRSHGLCLPYRFWPSLHLALSSVSASGSSPCAFCTSIAQVRSVLAITEAELHQFISMLLCLVAFC